MRDRQFARLVVAWQRRFGRHDLPWQSNRDPYRVLVAEVMLQQTQVQTVLKYFDPFVAAFPTLESLANAPLDAVNALWAGLGYYSRARNLHRCAQTVMEKYGGNMPSTANELQSLPGIGRSTAAAIASTCYSERVSILDGNARRLIARYLGFAEDLAKAQHLAQLWHQAEALLPAVAMGADMPVYTQALMDLGATVCTRSQPQCGACPLQPRCRAFNEHQIEHIPLRRKRLQRMSKAYVLLWCVRSDGAIWLQRREAAGIWGGLYSLPLIESEVDWQPTVPQRLVESVEPLHSIVHKLTHLDMVLQPIRLHFRDGASPALPGAWVGENEWRNLGLPTPVRRLLLPSSS